MVDITNDIPINIKEEIVEEEDKTPIEVVLEKPVPAPEPARFPVHPKQPAKKPVIVDKYLEPKENPTKMVSAAIVGLIAVLLASPLFKGLLEKVMPSLASGYMFHLLVFLLAAILFMGTQNLV